MTRETVLSWSERSRGSVQPHREEIIGVWVYTDCQSILHVFILTEVEAIALNYVLDVRVGGILTAGVEKELSELL